LATARKELADARAELARGGNSSGSGGESSHRIAELEQERAALESELELVRGRAAELYESLTQERRTLTEHRTETSTEMKQLRRIVEKQAELLSEREHAAPVAVAPTHAPSRSEVAVAETDETVESTEASDPVISSVMAQFAKLQKEVAERRKHRKTK
jgi:hypothetical protein